MFDFLQGVKNSFKMSINNQQDAVTLLHKYMSFVSMLVDPGAKDENKLKAAQEMSENFESIQISPHYGTFLEHALKIFLKILSSDPQFIAEHNIQQLRKLILEVLHRLPANDYLKPFIKDILGTAFQLLEVDNEENVLICLRIIIDTHKNFRPAFSQQTQNFLHFVRNIYKGIPNHINRIFDPKPVKNVKDLSEINVGALLLETYGITNIQTEKKNSDGTSLSYNLIPRGVVSLRVLAELPVIVVLMYQLYKPNVQAEIFEILSLIMNLIVLQPDQQFRTNPNFNKEIFVDFMSAQIKAMSFIAYTIRYHLDIVQKHSQKLVEGTMNQFLLCPAECVHLRRELLVALRHILSSDLRNDYLPQFSMLLDEKVIIGPGWTAHDALRILTYGTLADFIHHVRTLLKLEEYTAAVHLFSKICHDESVPVNTQTMACRLLMNLVDQIRVKAAEQENGSDAVRLKIRCLFTNMLQVFVMKFKTVAEIHMPALLQKENSDKAEPRQKLSLTYTLPPDAKLDTNDANKENKPKCHFPANPALIYSVVDCRSLTKTLVCGVRTITWGMNFTKSSLELGSKQFHPDEILLYIKLLKYGLIALDVFTLTVPGQNTNLSRNANSQAAKSKEEKEILEYFSGVFTTFSVESFREVFTPVIDFFVNRLHKNYTLQIIANSLLAHPAVSSIFSTILVEYLLDRMEAMGSNAEKSNLYLKLFKLVFGSVSLFPKENELMLKPHLHRIVNQSMELAKSAKDPYNYFLLLRALFRSIGGGSHDQLYQEFLPLLPNLLQGLNSLQSGDHKQVMKDLFVELSLTVPVRLSSLLPYLNKLMDPLVSALNGSQTLISQGLRTLELCVDNLQPDFLYDHIQPIGDKLMQALWQTLRNPSDNISRVAMRVLGKFGGGNRKMLGEPQKLEYNDRDSDGPSLDIIFSEYKVPVSLPVDKIIESAFKVLVTKDDSFYREQSWKVLLCFLVASMDLDCCEMHKLLSHPSFTEGEIVTQTPLYQCSDAHARKIHVLALAGMFVASIDKDIHAKAAPIVRATVLQYTIVSISQYCGPFSTNQKQRQWMDVLTVIDAIAMIMGHENKDYLQPANLALVQMYETATLVLGSLERACRLPIWEYMAEKMCSLCYDKAWYAKHGGCTAIKFLCEKMHLTWILEHQFVFLRALLSVVMDLTGEVSYGVVEMAKTNINHMLELCCTPINEAEQSKHLVEIQKKSLHEVTNELVKLIFSPNTFIREQCMHSLELLARLNNCSVTKIMEPHKEVLADMIPPKKILLRHQSANSQIGLMDGYTFCTTLSPRLFTIDMEIQGHNVFFGELRMLCESEDEKLFKLSVYKSVSNLIPIRRSALRALAACNYLVDKQQLIFTLIFKALDSPNVELQEEGFECMKKFIVGCQVDMEMVYIYYINVWVHNAMRPLLYKLGDYRSLNLSVILRLSHLTQLFPKTFNEKLCDQMHAHLIKWLEAAIHKGKTGDKKNANELKLCAAIIKIFYQIPAASKKFVELLIKLVMATEDPLGIEPCSPFREPLKSFLLRYPEETIEYFLNDTNLANFKHSRYLEYLLKEDSGKAFRDIMEKYSSKLTAAIFDSVTDPNTAVQIVNCKSDKRFSALKIIKRMANNHCNFIDILFFSPQTKLDEKWLSNQNHLVACIRNVWINKEYQESHMKPDLSSKNYYFNEPKLMVQCMLNFFKNHPKEIDLLFELLRALSGKFVCNFHFLRSFFERTVAQNYTIEWKRLAFFKFVEVFHNQTFPQELKGYILQYILIPSFTVAFERGENEKLIGGPPTPDTDPSDNIISVFILRVIDPENPFATSDAVRILLLQLSCIFVENASPHIHDAANKRQGNKLRRLMTYAWPCLLNKNYVDPSTKYHGHLLLSYIISKFAIHKRIVLQVFHSLLKAYAPEAKNVVRQCLEIVTPAMPSRMEDGNNMLTHWTKKIILEEGYSTPQLIHMLYLPVRHHKVYYKVRQYLLPNLISAMQRIGLSNSCSIEHKKLIVDLAEVIIKWELQYNRECQDQNELHPTSDDTHDRLSPPGTVYYNCNYGVYVHVYFLSSNQKWLAVAFSWVIELDSILCIVYSQNLVKHYEKNKDGASDIKTALNTMTGIASHINDMKRKHEHAVRVQEIQSLLYGWIGQDLTTYGELVAEGIFRVYGAKGLRQCSDLMLIESVPGEPLSFHIIPFDKPKCMYTLQARTVDQKREWSLQLKRVILENYNAVIPSHARQLVMELGQSKKEDGLCVDKYSTRKQHSAPEYLEKRKQERRKSETGLKALRIKRRGKKNNQANNKKSSLSSPSHQNTKSTSEQKQDLINEKTDEIKSPPTEHFQDVNSSIEDQELKNNGSKLEPGYFSSRESLSLLHTNESCRNDGKQESEDDCLSSNMSEDNLGDYETLAFPQRKQCNRIISSEDEGLSGDYVTFDYAQKCLSRENVCASPSPAEYYRYYSKLANYDNLVHVWSENGVLDIEKFNQDSEVENCSDSNSKRSVRRVQSFNSASLSRPPSGIDQANSPTAPSVWLKKQGEHLAEATNKSGSLPRSFLANHSIDNCNEMQHAKKRSDNGKPLENRPITIASDRPGKSDFLDDFEQYMQNVPTSHKRRSNKFPVHNDDCEDQKSLGAWTECSDEASVSMEIVHPEYKIYRNSNSRSSLRSVLANVSSKLSAGIKNTISGGSSKLANVDQTRSCSNISLQSCESENNFLTTLNNRLSTYSNVSYKEDDGCSVNSKASPSPRSSAKIVYSIAKVYGTMLKHRLKKAVEAADTSERQISKITHHQQSEKHKTFNKPKAKVNVYMKSPEQIGARIANADDLDYWDLNKKEPSTLKSNVLYPNNVIKRISTLRPDSVLSESSNLTSSSNDSDKPPELPVRNRIESETSVKNVHENDNTCDVSGDSYYEKSFEAMENMLENEMFRDSAIYSDQEDSDNVIILENSKDFESFKNQNEGVLCEPKIMPPSDKSCSQINKLVDLKKVRGNAILETLENLQKNTIFQKDSNPNQNIVGMKSIVQRRKDLETWKQTLKIQDELCSKVDSDEMNKCKEVEESENVRMTGWVKHVVGKFQDS
ncbi:Transformation/transcription domain-associated protein [Nymphon striatum]|nr:Transformation/transcription domain-associated protein [Nymphon striatum]